MTHAEIGILFGEVIQTKGFLTSAGLEPEEDNLFINTAIDLYLKSLPAGWEERVDDPVSPWHDLRSLKEEESPSPESTTSVHSVFPVPTTLRDQRKVVVNLTSDCYTTAVDRKARVVSETVIEDFLRDRYLTTRDESPLAYYIGDKLRVVHDSKFTPVSVKITFIKSFTPVDVRTTDTYPLPDKVIYDIVRFASIHTGKIIETSQQKIENLSTKP